MKLLKGIHLLVTHGEYSSYSVDTLVVINEDTDTDVLVAEYVSYRTRMEKDFDPEFSSFSSDHFLNWLLNLRKVFTPVLCLEWKTMEYTEMPERKRVTTIEVGEI